MQMAAEKAAEKLEQIEAKKLEEIERKMGLIKTKIESWMGTNQLPDNMKEPIITCIRHRLEENKDFDMEKPISYISKDLMTKIRHYLCLPLLKNVSLFCFLLRKIDSRSIENYNYSSWEKMQKNKIKILNYLD
jgi:hypothetical protein